jgi:chemotaxis protein histidine kinase CheA
VQRQAPAANRAAQRQERIQQRAQRQAPAANRAAERAGRSNAPAAGAQVQQNARPLSAAQTRQQQRAERSLQQRENRALRALPPQQRAARRQELQQQRSQRAQQRQQPQQNAVQSRGLNNNAQNAGPRRNGQARVTQQAARQGRFASAFAAARGGGNAGANAGRSHSGRFAARQAWRQGLRAAFVPWYGPVFYPYAYSDIFDYTFWPSGYDDGYYAYAYDDFFDGVFYGEQGPPPQYVEGYEDAAPATASAPAPAPAPTYAAVQQLCAQPGNGVTSWPFAEIQQKVVLNDEQKQLLNDVRSAGQKAAGGFKASCPSENAFPLTPPGRLNAMLARLDATLEAIDTVKPALEKFYDSLSDEQKERFNQIGPKPQETTGQAAQASASATNSCKDQKPGLANLPIEKIEDAVKPTDAQIDDLNRLEEATGKAVSIMQAACPDDVPLTPPGRLEAMEKRLQAMIDAGKTVKPALDGFYGSLTAEQKARFDRIGKTLAQNN